MRMRTIKSSAEGRYSRDEVRKLVRATHVLELDSAGWEVRTLGMRGSSRQFSSQADAMAYARDLEPNCEIVVHQRNPKKITTLPPAAKGRKAARLQEVQR